MPSKERLIDGDVLNGDDALLACDVNHTIDHQKRKAVRQDAKNVIDVQRSFGWSFGRRVSIAHWVTSGAKIILYRAATDCVVSDQ